MTSNIHRLLMLLGSVEVFAVTTLGGAGLAPQQVMLWLGAAGAITIFAANTIRGLWPDKQVVVTTQTSPKVTVAEQMSATEAPPVNPKG